jgi:PST family polysaccharide transporter
VKALEIGGRLLRSSSAATFSQVWRTGVTLVTLMALRRLVEPESWGLWHWAAEFLFILLSQVRDLGLPAHMVRDKDRPYGNFLALEAGWGAGLCLVVCAASPLLVLASSEPTADAVPLLRALTLFLFFEGLAKVPLTYFEAEIQVDQALFAELMRNVCFAATSISLAIAEYGVWSLLIAHVAAAGVYAALLWWRAWGQMPRTWIRGATWPLVRSSLPLMLMALVLLAVEWVDYQIVTARFSHAVVGLYGGALSLAMLVPRVLEMPLRRALYPTFVAVKDSATRFFETYRLATVLLLSIQVPFSLLLYCNAETVLVLVWSAPYAEAAGFLRILCWVPLIQPFVRCAEDVLLTRHEERILIAASVINLAMLIVLGVRLTWVLGPIGMAWAKLLPLGSIVTTWAVYRVDPRAFRRLVANLTVVYGVPAVLFVLASLAAGPGTYLRLGLSLVAAAASFLVSAARFGPAFLEFFRTTGSPGDDAPD